MGRTLTVLNHGSESFTGKTLSKTFGFEKTLQPELVTRIEQIFRWAEDPNPSMKTTSVIRTAEPVRKLDENSRFLVTQGQGTSGKQGGYNPDRASMIGDSNHPGYFGESETQLHAKQIASAEKQSARNVRGGLTSFGMGFMKMAKLGATEDIGVYANVDRLYNHLLKCRENTFLEPITKINMVGWSRGAVTCLRQANFLEKHFPDIEINIFGVDPVAGLGQDTDDGDYASNRIPDNVKKYIFIIAGNEDRFAFPPLPLPEQYMKYTCLPFPGDHSNVAKTDNSSGTIVAHLCYKFLKQNGSLDGNPSYLRDRMKRELCLGVSDLLQHYDKLLCSIMGYMTPGYNPANIVQAHTVQRPAMGMATSFDSGRGSNVFAEKFFINQHHKTLFQATHPTVYAELCATTGNNQRLAGDYTPTGLSSQLPEHVKRIKQMLCYRSRQEIRALMDDTSERRGQDFEDLKRVQMSLADQGLID